MNEDFKDLAKKNWGDSFVTIYNDFFNYENQKLFIDSDKLYVYATLCSLMRMNGSIVTNLNVIEECLPVPYSHNNPNYNRKKIKEILITLKKQNIIEADEEILRNLRSNEIVTLYIDTENIHGNMITKGFEKVSFKELYQSKSPMDFYLRCCVIRYDFNPLHKDKLDKYTKGFSCSYEEWGRILDRTKRNAIKIINDAIEREVLYVNIGDYISDNNQNVNTYKIRPIDNSNKTQATVIKENKKNKINKNMKKAAFGGDESIITPF